MTKEMTAAERYARLKEERFEQWLESSFTNEALKRVDLYEVKCPSGMIFKCRKPGPELSAISGAMPATLSAYVVPGGKTNDDPEQAAADRFREMSPAERRSLIQLTARLIRYIAVSPRIVHEVGNMRDAVSVDAIETDDFNYLATWASGGESAEGLKTFRRRGRRVS